jgi:hypothetical protein
MPAKSRAQQRLMQAAEHGAMFPMAQKLRQSMTHQQLHDFSVGSEVNKPQHVLHPKMVAHGAKVAAAHRTLAARPGFMAQPAPVRMKQIQAHIRRGGR